MKKNINKIFGSMVFNESEMKKTLPREIYEKMRRIIREGNALEPEIADIVANAMKDWAILKGATHFTHWFQPLTGITAGKHDSFIEKDTEGKIYMHFSGKELIKGEPDASSFPSGGLRSTFEARGYTSWDPTSYAFILEKTLYIPSIFCSFGGQTLDEKTPLLKSIELIHKHSLRILRIFGDNITKQVFPTLGLEQEYFLIDKKFVQKRLDLLICGRTLFDTELLKDQKIIDHYFGAIKPKINSFMQDLDLALWQLGVPAKTKHNEVAPCQYELACIFTTANLAIDQNKIVMEMMKKIAEKYDLVCILHEKPFWGINGSGKHNNWSLATNKGENLLTPSKNQEKNSRFLLFLCAIIKAVDKFQDLLRASVATSQNDLRLGGNEAPPAILSVFLGETLTEELKTFYKNEVFKLSKENFIQPGIEILANIPKDSTDRNRTSPMAFTGNKFEFRMPGAGASAALPTIIINTIVAESLCEFADNLENCSNLEKNIKTLIKETVKNHEKIIFNGNSYSSSWQQEAQNRGLYNLVGTPEALECLISKKNLELFEKYSIFTEQEINSRYNILVQNYCNTLNLEAKIMINMIKTQILPATFKYIKFLSDTIKTKKEVIEQLNIKPEKFIINLLNNSTEALFDNMQELEHLLENPILQKNNIESAKNYKNYILPLMQTLRITVQKIEKNIEKKYWPFPTSCEILENS